MLLDKIFSTFLGIEFKEDTIVITCLENNFSGITILSSSTFPLKENDAVIGEIREFISKYSTDMNRVFVSIPDRWAIIKFTEIPSVKGKGKASLANLMRFEIERHIPYDIDEVAYDFLLMGERDGTYAVVFAAVQKGKMDFVRDFLEKLSLQPDSITISSFAILNAIELSGVPVGGWQEIIGIVRKSGVLGNKNENNIMLYVNRMSIHLAIIREGLCSHMRSFGFGTERPLHDYSEDISDYIAEMQSLLNVEYFNKLILTGDVSSITAAADDLQGKLGSKGITINRITKYSGDIKGVELNGLESSVGAAFAGLGIGTYRANLLPHKTVHEIRQIAPLATKIFLVLILLLVVGIFSTEAVKHKRFLTKIEKELKKNEPEVKALEELSSEIDLQQKRSAFLRTLKENEITLEILAELARVLPQDSWVSNLSYKGFDIKNLKKSGGELTISGYAKSSSSLIPLLEDSPLFEKVEFVGPIKKTRDKEQFKLSAQVVRPQALRTELSER